MPYTIRPSVVLALSSLLGAFACTPLQKPEVIVPTAPALSDPSEGDEIAVRVLLVAYAGAADASEEVTRTRVEAKERALMLTSLARSEGEDFSNLVRTYSDGPPLADPGPVGLRVKRGSKRLDPSVEAAAFGLSQEQVSAPVLTPQGYVVVMRTKDPPTTPEQVAAKHILISFTGARGASEQVSRSREEALALAQEIANRAKAEGADWDALHAENSDEPGSTAGGDLGTFGHGQMVPAFERAAFALKVGEISKPVESPFGFHVIQRYH